MIVFPLDAEKLSTVSPGDPPFMLALRHLADRWHGDGSAPLSKEEATGFLPKAAAEINAFLKKNPTAEFQLGIKPAEVDSSLTRAEAAGYLHVMSVRYFRMAKVLERDAAGDPEKNKLFKEWYKNADVYQILAKELRDSETGKPPIA